MAKFGDGAFFFCRRRLLHLHTGSARQMLQRRRRRGSGSSSSSSSSNFSVRCQPAANGCHYVGFFI
jgi:hypothetical protein